jgi:myo-inositol-1(or 4)-monophosphatase
MLPSMTTEEKFQTLTTYIESLGDIAREYFNSPSSLNEQKGDGSVVTHVDKLIEDKLRAFIEEHFPGEAILGEEHGLAAGSGEFVWVIDPIDGTDNFVRKIPFFAITAARLGSGPDGSCAIIYNPISRQLFSSFAGNEMTENGNPCLMPEEVVGGRHFITVTGTNSSAEWIKPARQHIQRALYLEFGKSGHYHSSLLELAYVAAGRFEGILQLEMNAWDSASGLSMVRANGGAISVLKGGTWQRCEGSLKELYGDDFSARPTVFSSRLDIHDRALALIGNPPKWADA